MFSELPKLLGRDFAIGFFLPVMLFLIVTNALFDAFDQSAAIAVFSQQSPLVDAALAVLVAWIGAVLLVSVNYEVYRFLEGYGRFNPLRLLGFAETKRYRNLRRLLEENKTKRDTLKKQEQEIPGEIVKQQIRLTREAADSFPDDEKWLLPTSFGNTIRAFEVYSSTFAQF